MWRAIHFNACSGNKLGALLNFYSIFIPIFQFQQQLAMILILWILWMQNLDYPVFVHPCSCSSNRYQIIYCSRLIMHLQLVVLLAGVFENTKSDYETWFSCCHVMQLIQMRLQDFREGSPALERNRAGKSAAEKKLNIIWIWPYRIMLYDFHMLSCFAAHSNKDSGFHGRKSYPWKEPCWEVCRGKNPALHLNMPISDWMLWLSNAVMLQYRYTMYEARLDCHDWSIFCFSWYDALPVQEKFEQAKPKSVADHDDSQETAKEFDVVKVERGPATAQAQSRIGLDVADPHSPLATRPMSASEWRGGGKEAEKPEAETVQLLHSVCKISLSLQSVSRTTCNAGQPACPCFVLQYQSFLRYHMLQISKFWPLMSKFLRCLCLQAYHRYQSFDLEYHVSAISDSSI